MTVRKSQMFLPNPTTGQQEVHHFETELEQIADMTAYARNILGTVTDAASMQSYIGVSGTMLSRNTSYAVGDITYSPQLPSYLRLETVVPGTTGTTEPDFNVSTGGYNRRWYMHIYYRRCKGRNTRRAGAGFDVSPCGLCQTGGRDGRQKQLSPPCCAC